MLRSVLIVLLHMVLYGHSADDWCYKHPDCDPSTWNSHYPDCALSSQSPINIETDNAVLDDTLEAIKISGAFGSSAAVITNNGHTVEVVLSTQYTLTGAGLSYPHRLAAFHVHFGNSESDNGSEHQINGDSFPLEVHFVFYNLQYQDLTEAKTHSDGLAVVGLLFQIGSFNSALNDIINQLPQVAYKGLSASFSFNLGNFLPSNLKNYYTYHGSLTTPGCSENVKWHVLGSVQSLSSSQYHAIVSSLYHSSVDSEDPELLEDNFRPVQPLNGRTVLRSHL
ncbi:carbonic anhydrase 14-like [Pelodytes ibericus]